MAGKRIKAVLITSVVLAMAACTSNIPVSNQLFKGENFQDLDQEYTFSTKDLTAAYLKRKLDKWLDTAHDGLNADGIRLVRELAYIKYKDPTMYCSLVARDSTLAGRINSVQAIRDRKAVDTAFNDFIDGCLSGPEDNAEFQVNTYTTWFQRNSDVAMDNTGDFVVTWYSDGQDGSGYGVYAQRYNSKGEPQPCQASPECNAETGEFRVNTYTDSFQYLPSVAMDNTGDFVITWDSRYQDGSRYSVYAKRYNSQGVAQPCSSSSPECNAETGEFRVNTQTTGEQSFSSVAMDGTGNFVVSWQSESQDSDVWGIYAQRYNSSGEPQPCPVSSPECNQETGEFRVNSYITGSQEFTAVAMNDGGDFVITWQDDDGHDGNSHGVFARRFNPSGEPQSCSGSLCDSQTGEFQVNSSTTGEQRYPAAALDYAGNFVITWVGAQGIFAQRYNPSGEPQPCSGEQCDGQSGEFRLNPNPEINGWFPDIAMDDSGDFLVAWTAYGELDGSGGGIFARRYNSSGIAETSEFKVNDYTESDQTYQAVAIDNAGDFVVTWNDYGGHDGDYYGVFAHRFKAN
jgi:hypothetical protein